MRHIPLLLLFPLAATAQPILEYANVDLMGKTYPLHMVTDPGTSDPNLDGANVTWDFSSATLQMDAASCSFVDPGSTPYGASYPTANLAQSVTYLGTTGYTYFNLIPARLDMLAEGIGSGDETIYTDPKTPLEFPFSYPNYFIDYFTYDGTNYSVSRAYMGYGTVILPTGIDSNVVKMASTSGAITFFRSNPVEPLVQIEDDGTTIVWGDAQVGIEETGSTTSLNAFPNPATDAVAVTGLSPNAPWQLLDAAGRVQQSGVHQQGALQIDLSELPSGPYVVKSAGSTVRVVKR